MEEGDKQSGLKGHSQSIGQLIEIKKAWWRQQMSRLECRTSGWDQKGLVEEGDKQLGSKGHSWSIGQSIEIKRAWWRQEMSGQD